MYVDPWVVGVLGYLPQDLIGQVSYEYYHPDNIQKMVQLHHDGERGGRASWLTGTSLPPSLPLPVFPPSLSHEASHSHAHSPVLVPEQEAEVGVAGHEGILISQPVLPAGGVCGVHQRGHEVRGGGGREEDRRGEVQESGRGRRRAG